jgi:hypothetical protein
VRAVAGRPCKIRFRLEQEDGTLATADALTDVSVRVLDGTGTEISTGTATEESTGVYAYTLQHRDDLDTLTVEFSATLDGMAVAHAERVRMQDRRLVPLSILRSDENLSLLDADEFLRVVDAAEDVIADAIEFSPVVVGSRVSVRSPGALLLRLPGVRYPVEVYALEQDGDAVAPEDVMIEDGGLARPGYGYSDFLSGGPGNRTPWPAAFYSAHLAHGLHETPADLQRAATALVKYLAKHSVYPDRAKRVMTEQTDIWLSSPGPEAPTGLPEVDAVLVRYREQAVV